LLSKRAPSVRTSAPVNASGSQRLGESLRQEMQPKGVRVGLVEPGIVETELDTHIRSGIREAVAKQMAGVEKLRPEDIADAVAYMVARDRRIAVNEMLLRAGA